ncbi:g_PROTEIN_RECEP_F2_3 domain-containing protein [Caerostris extrusa]|uniref:G_PROTEIN_RECEP_F2_3 domain-containing protein n=1 Tax=Caerostris extrusa TaxID=172846 RepID=A0AAV4VPI8_CAEEX|nr:g_PROTEIN_RECEP_F2_3 domain-containing protein [Caerostris extrusa]
MRSSPMRGRLLCAYLEMVTAEQDAFICVSDVSNANHSSVTSESHETQSGAIRRTPNLPAQLRRFEAVPWTTNSLDLAPNESLPNSPTTSFATETQSSTKGQSETTTPTQEPPKRTSPETFTIAQVSSALTSAATTEDASGRETTTMNTVLSSTDKIQVILPTSRPPVLQENATVFEEMEEHNAIVANDFESSTDKEINIIVGHKCQNIPGLESLE